MKTGKDLRFVRVYVKLDKCENMKDGGILGWRTSK